MGSHSEYDEIVEDVFSGELMNYEPYEIDEEQAEALRNAGEDCQKGWWIVSNTDDYSQSHWLVDNIIYLGDSEREAQEICDEYWEEQEEFEDDDAYLSVKRISSAPNDATEEMIIILDNEETWFPKLEAIFMGGRGADERELIEDVRALWSDADKTRFSYRENFNKKYNIKDVDWPFVVNYFVEAFSEWGEFDNSGKLVRANI